MSEALATRGPDDSAIEQALVQGNLAALTPGQRVAYYNRVCESIGLNPLTKPFEYITLNGKLTLYARKDCTDQLRTIKGISIEKPDVTFQDEWIVVTVVARDAKGRTDSDIGVVSKKDMRGDFGNAVMKCVTKAKRRVTLSICGLGMLDETEVETIPAARTIAVEEAHGGEIADEPDPLAPWGKFLNDEPNLDGLNAKLAEFGKLPKTPFRANVWGMLNEYATQSGWHYDNAARKFVAVTNPDADEVNIPL